MSANAVEARIAGRNFTLACEPDEKADLEEAVRLVSERVDEAYAQSNTASAERLLLLAALNLAHDMRRLRGARGGTFSAAVASSKSDATDADLIALRERIDQALQSR